MICGMMPPPAMTVSVARQIDYEVAHYTTDGIVDETKFSLTTLTRFIEELQSYEVIIEQMKEAMMVVSVHALSVVLEELYSNLIRVPLRFRCGSGVDISLLRWRGSPSTCHFTQ
jgi:hypothetical protein